jgi:hypothetical protein
LLLNMSIYRSLLTRGAFLIGGEGLPHLRYEPCEIVRLDKGKVCECVFHVCVYVCVFYVFV